MLATPWMVALAVGSWLSKVLSWRSRPRVTAEREKRQQDKRGHLCLRGRVVLVEGEEGAVANQEGPLLAGLDGLLHQPLHHRVDVDEIQTCPAR